MNGKPALTFDEAFARVRQLVLVFKKGEKEYLAPGYSEAQARQDFIDKFWVALGWDVYHETQTNPYEQEVKVERGVMMSAARKRADYTFLAANFRDILFYAEAKKPKADVDTADNYFQTIRYGWSSQTPLAILTDFEHLRILDCRYKPDIQTALNRAVKKFHYSEYADEKKFGEIYWLFSREAATNRSLEQFAATLPKPTGKAHQRTLFGGGYQSIDESFLRELDGFRAELASSFKSKNQRLNSEELTEVTQRTLDRLVFMRFLEDKLIEPEALVEGLGTKGTVWQDFIATSRRLDSVYNGIIFKNHSLLDAPNFYADEHIFEGIREKLAHTNSPYDFNAIPIHILGSIYERFLGKVIVATDKRAKVVEKPEVRKAGGVYYTPEYIVTYIVENTVGEIIRDKTPEQIAKMKFADIACGSGSFLLGVYDLLLRYHTAYYNEPKNRAKAIRAECVERDDGTLHLGLRQKKDILLNNIYGVDLDAQAVEVAQFSLFLKLLEDETIGSAKSYQLELRETMLPSLDKNIKHGNSLVGWDILDERLFETGDERKLHPMDFTQAFSEAMKKGGFDALVGNPPYIDSEWMTTYLPETRRYCTPRYKAASGNWDIFCVFVERTLQLTKDGGMAGLIVPNKLGSANYATGAREVLTSDNKILSLRDYSSVPVFPVAVYPIVYIAQKMKPKGRASVQYERMRMPAYGDAEVTDAQDLSYKRYFSNPVEGWSVFADIQAANPTARLSREFPKLDAVAQVLGAATVAEAYQIKSLIENEAEVASGDLIVSNSGTIDRYELLWGVKPMRYLGAKFQHPIISQDSASSLPRKRFRQATTPKLILAGMTKMLECAGDFEGRVLAGKSTTIVITSLDLKYLLGILNSKLISFFYTSIFGGNRLQGGYLRVGPPQIRSIPIRALNLAINADKAQYDRVVKLVEDMLTTKQSLHSARTDSDRRFYENKCTNLDSQINVAIYNLYGLTDKEIAVIEES